MSTIKNYAVQVYWDDRAEYFVAEIPEIPTCAADGTTPAEALSNLEQTFAVMKEAYHEDRLTLPEPDTDHPLSVEKLSELSELVKVARLAELAGLPGQTLAAKLKRKTPFSAAEARRLARALREHGLALR
jgi:predicted RNase H-like HicB family nuclease